MAPSSRIRSLTAGSRWRIPATIRPRSLWRQRQARRIKGRLAGPKLIEAFADVYPEAFFIEIGSNDGEQHDHLSLMIRARSWSGIMIEPVPYVFQRLRANYDRIERVALENVAIADRDGALPFFHLEQAGEGAGEGLPSWYDAIGSFSREAVLAHARHIPDIQDRIVSTEVPCLTFESLCRKHDVGRIDLILIDTEGYDYEIIRRIDLAARGPRLLVYEHYHLPAATRTACREGLEAAGYETMAEGFDTWCLRTDRDDVLTRSWRGLRPGIPAVSADAEPS